MAKIPFDIKFRPQVESGEYKVITAKEQPVRIICWDRSTTYWKIIALVLAPDGKTENPFTYDVEGKESDGCLHDHEFDIFLVTPEPELSEFEEKVRVCVTENLTTHIKDGNGREMSSTVLIDDETAKKMAAELLELANKELKNHEFAIFTREEFDAEIEEAKAEALKDLPRWKKAICGKRFDDERGIVLTEDNELFCTCYAKEGEYYISSSDLEKLPKEEEQ